MGVVPFLHSPKVSHFTESTYSAKRISSYFFLSPMVISRCLLLLLLLLFVNHATISPPTHNSIGSLLNSVAKQENEWP